MERFLHFFRYFILLYCLLNSALAQDFTWLSTSSGNDAEIARKFVFKNNNVYVCGLFKQNISIDNTPVGGSNSLDIFLVKYNCNRQVEWVRTLGSSDDDNYCHVDADADENVYVTGAFKGTLNLQNGSGMSSVTLAGGANFDLFYAKYDKNGKLLWVKTGGGLGLDYPGDLKVHDDGKFLIAGTYGGGGSGYSAKFDNKNFGNAGGSEGLLMCFDSSGNLSWSNTIVSVGADLCNALSCDASGNIFMTGFYGSSGNAATFNSTGMGAVTKTNDGNTDAFLAKYTPSGQLQWVQTVKGTGAQSGEAVCTDALGNSYWAVNYVQNGQVSSQSGAAVNIFPLGGVDIVISKFDPSGTRIWTKTFGAGNDEVVRRMICDGSSIFLVGEFGIATKFGSINVISAGGVDGYFVEMDSSGIVKVALNVGGTTAIQVFDVHVNACGYPAFCGAYLGNVNFQKLNFPAAGANYNMYIVAAGYVGNDTLYIQDEDTVICKKFDTARLYVAPVQNAVYRWFRNGTLIPGADSFVYNATAAGDYFSVIEAQCCVIDSTRSVRVMYSEPNISAKDISFCEGDTLRMQLTTADDYNIVWSPVFLVDSAFIKEPLILSTYSAMFIVTATDKEGCSTADTVDVTVFTKPMLDAGPNINKCAFDTVTITASGSGYFRWTPANGLSDTTAANPKTFVQENSTYYVQLTDENGCTNNDSVKIRVPKGRGILLNNDTALCEQKNFVIGDVENLPFAHYTWSTGDTTDAININTGGSYWVIAQDTVGCKSYDTIEVRFVIPTIPYLGPDTFVCPAVTFELRDFNNSAFVSFLWNTKERSEKIYPDKPGAYFVQTTDSNGCVSSDTVNVFFVKANPVHLGEDTLLCHRDTFTIHKQDRYIFDSYLWSDGSTTTDLTISSSGEYWLRVRDSFNCIYSDTINIIFSNDLDTLFIPNVFTPNESDTLNRFFPYPYSHHQIYDVQIFNRWGERIFKSTDEQKYLDGNFKEAPVIEGLYLYMVFYRNCVGRKKHDYGVFRMIR